MNDNVSKPSALLERLAWLVGTPEGQEHWKRSLRGTHRINCDPEDPSRAWLTRPDESVVYGRLLENGDFVPDELCTGSHKEVPK